MPLNFEIKAICNNVLLVKTVLEQHKAKFIGTDHQIDTYFNCVNGRLKLREGNIERNLIYYERSNDNVPKASKVQLFRLQETLTIKTMLSQALGIKVIVEKHREIYFIDNVKIHIDKVFNLGNFIEIEAIDTDGTIPLLTLQTQCNFFINAFELNSSNFLSLSYSDMLLNKDS